MTLRAEALGYARFLRRLPAFLRQRVSVDDARAIVKRRLQEREANFLSMLERAVFGNASSRTSAG